MTCSRAPMRRKRPRSPLWRSAPPRSARSTRTGSAISGLRSRSISRPTGGASKRSTPPRGRAWVDLRPPFPRRVQRRPAARAVPALGADLRRPAAARHAGRRRAPAPPGRAPHLRRGVRRARRHRCRPRGRRPQHGSRGRGPLRAARALRGAAQRDVRRGRVPGCGRRLPPARRGRDRAHGPEPGGHAVRALSFPGLAEGQRLVRATRLATSASAFRTSAAAWKPTRRARAPSSPA